MPSEADATLARADATAGDVIEAAVAVHAAVGRGHPAAGCQDALKRRLVARGRLVESSPAGARMVVDACVLVDVACVPAVLPSQCAALHQGLRESGLPCGVLLNFGAPAMRDGVVRMDTGRGIAERAKEAARSRSRPARRPHRRAR